MPATSAAPLVSGWQGDPSPPSSPTCPPTTFPGNDDPPQRRLPYEVDSWYRLLDRLPDGLGGNPSPTGQAGTSTTHSNRQKGGGMLIRVDENPVQSESIAAGAALHHASA